MNTQMQDIPADQSLIDYPCRFPIKVMGATHIDFAATIVDVVLERAHRSTPGHGSATCARDPRSSAITRRFSKLSGTSVPTMSKPKLP